MIDDNEETGFLLTEAAGHVLTERYKLLDSTGRGGMGSVRLALQGEPVWRKVAVTFINAGKDSRLMTTCDLRFSRQPGVRGFGDGFTAA
jgi:hypothetical protein